MRRRRRLVRGPAAVERFVLRRRRPEADSDGPMGEGLVDDAVASVSLSSVSRSSSAASVSSSKASLMARNPTGASLLTASVPRKSRSPSARTLPARISSPSDVATRAEGHAGAGDEGLEQHIARAEAQTVAPGGRVQACLPPRARDPSPPSR